VVAGIGHGLVKEGDHRVVLLIFLGTKILGDMDSSSPLQRGITAIQMDIKIRGYQRDDVQAWSRGRKV